MFVFSFSDRRRKSGRYSSVPANLMSIAMEAEHNLAVFYITEQVQMVIHEEPPHRLAEISNALNKNMFETIGKNPDLMKTRDTMIKGTVI
jgi:hypothetical protein